MTEFDFVVFDLGGVLVEFGGVEAMGRLSGIEDADELWRKWLTCRWVREFESGRCSEDEFATGVVADWGLPISGDAYLADFSAWIGGPMTRAEQLVRDVKERVGVACLSNTNSAHWDSGAAEWPLHDLFDHQFLSFRLGMLKPDREIFDHVANALGTDPGRLLFLDDNLLNVEAASAAGWRAFVVRGVDEARQVLVDEGVLG
jgi:HAD superfamily hydrolase (TIGR01509 family)